VRVSATRSLGCKMRACCFVRGYGASRPEETDVDIDSVLLLPLAQISRHLHLGYFPSQAGGYGEQGHHCSRADEDPAQTQLDQRAGDGV